MTVPLLFSGLKQFIKSDDFETDNIVFRLHYMFTCLMLVAFSTIVTARQYFGDPIDCFGANKINQNLLDSFCWIHTTYSIDSAWDKKVGIEVSYPGIANGFVDGKASSRTYHAYYQWVCFVLFFQAIAFYVPRYVWKMVEGNRLKCLHLNLDSLTMKQKEREDKCDILVRYMNLNRGCQNGTFATYFLLEIANLANVLLQMYAINRFLGGKFYKIGLQALLFDDWGDGEVRDNPLLRVFPRMTKCTFHDFGSSGSINSYSVLCLLSLNNINEKIFVILWYWFIVLTVFSCLAVIYRLLTAISVNARIAITQVRCRMASKSTIEMAVNQLSVGDWFVIDRLAKNMAQVNFALFVERFHKHMDCSCKGHGCKNCQSTQNNKKLEDESSV